MPATIKAEANLLRFPIFALHTKGLGQLDGIEVAGTRRIDGSETSFRLAVTRNVADTYPGPLSRKVHFALLSLVSDQGLPFQNPIGFSWRDLAKRMGLAYHGKRIDSLKSAIRSTAGIEIRTKHALKGPLSEQYLPDVEEASYKLYYRYVFRNDANAEGGRWDANYVWLSQWYLDNLNRLYVAPVDYRLWKNLNESSPIASRLYEFLLFNFTGLSVLRVNYPKLAQFLPVAVQRYASLAQRQLDPALALIRKHRVINQCRWEMAKDGSPQLIVSAGKAVRSVCGRKTGNIVMPADEFAEVSVRELRHLRSPAYTLVHQFHAAWGRDRNFRPTKSELNSAAEIIEEFGKDHCEQLLPIVVDAMRQHFPSAKTFGASRPYGIDAEREAREGRERSARATAKKEREDAISSLAREKDKEWVDAKRAAWDALSKQEKAAVENHIRQKYSHLGIKRGSAAFVSLCLREIQSDE